MLNFERSNERKKYQNFNVKQDPVVGAHVCSYLFKCGFKTVLTISRENLMIMFPLFGKTCRVSRLKVYC